MLNTISKIVRYFNNGLSYVLGLEKVIGSPAHIHIETTNICNFKCVYCPQSMPDEHFQFIGKGQMTYDQYKQILELLLREFKIERIILTRDGEPLINREIEKFVWFTNQKGIKTTIGSNGSLISLKRARLLIKSGLSIMKGDLCADKNEYENLRVGSRFEKSLEGYRNILRAAKELNADFKLVLVDLHTYNLSEATEIHKSIENLRSLFEGFEDRLSIGKAMMHNALGESQEIFSSSQKIRSDKKYNLCHHPWLEMVIDFRGNVVGCCRDLRSEYQVGNIFNAKNIKKEIWNGEKMRQLRKNLKNRHPENINICSKCDLPYGVSYAGNSISGKIMKFLRN